MSLSLPEASNFKIFRSEKGTTYLLFRDFGVNGGPAYIKVEMGVPKELSDLNKERKKREEEMDREMRIQHEIEQRVAAEKERKKSKISGAMASAAAKIESKIRERVEKEVREGLPGEKKKVQDLEAVDLYGSEKDGDG